MFASLGFLWINDSTFRYSKWRLGLIIQNGGSRVRTSVRVRVKLGLRDWHESRG